MIQILTQDAMNILGESYEWMKKYPAQLMIYCFAEGLEFGLIIFKNKSSGQIKQFSVKLDLDYLDKIFAKARMINDIVKVIVEHGGIDAGGSVDCLPERINKLRTCEGCDFNHICLPDIHFDQIKIQDDPIFEKEIKRKTEKLLSLHGYVPSAKEELADYRLSFEVGMDLREVTGYGHSPIPLQVGYGHYWNHYYGSYGMYVPYARSVYNHWLIMRVSDTGRLNPLRKGIVEWVGEAATARYSADLREAINYLLVGSFEYFGQDTKKRMTVTIDENNPMIKEIME